MDYMCKTIELAIKCGAKTINIPDTVGYTIPEEFTKIIKQLKIKFQILIKQFYQLIVIMI